MVGDILQPTHLLFILVVALLVLGPKRLPEVGRTLGSGLRDFKAAINGESHDDPAPSGYVETEADSAAPHDAESEPAGFDLGAGDSAEHDADETEPATPTALHEQHLDPQAAGDDLYAPDATEDLHPPAATDDLPPTDVLQAPAATDDLQPTNDLHAPAATDELHTGDLQAPAGTDEDTELDAVPAPVAAASSNGFASALASSRQRPADDGEPAVHDE